MFAADLPTELRERGGNPIFLTPLNTLGNPKNQQVFVGFSLLKRQQNLQTQRIVLFLAPKPAVLGSKTLFLTSQDSLS